MMGFPVTIVGKLLPESRFKEVLRRLYFARLYNPLYALNKSIIKAELLQDDILLVALNDGSKFYGLPDTSFTLYMKYGDPEKLGKIKEFQRFGSFLTALQDQYKMGMNESHYKLKKGDIVVDAGAHVGAFTVRAAKIVGVEGRVIAVEPEVNNLTFLQRNIDANEVQNVIIIPKGIWSRKGRLRLYLSGETWSHSFSSQQARSNEFTEIEVDTLDNILKELGIKQVDFCKVDIEGAEVEALKGMHETLRSKVNLAVEVGHRMNGKVTYKNVFRQLKELAFEVRIKDQTVYAWRRP